MKTKGVRRLVKPSGIIYRAFIQTKNGGEYLGSWKTKKEATRWRSYYLKLYKEKGLI